MSRMNWPVYYLVKSPYPQDKSIVLVHIFPQLVMNVEGKEALFFYLPLATVHAAVFIPLGLVYAKGDLGALAIRASQ